MSWVQENKFLAGFAGVTLVGAGVLGFLLLQAKGRHEAARTTYEEKSNELNRLQTLQPFPSAENVKKLDEQRKEHAVAIKQLQQSLAKLELPLENVTTVQFQDRLRAAVDAINQSANQNGIKRTDTFTLGFDRYLSEPPRPEAAALLARQLKAIELIVKGMISSRVTELRDLKRQELPEEKAGPAPEPAGKGKGPKSDKPQESLLTSSTVEITFFADQTSFMQILNGIISTKEQFFIPRLVTVKNEKDTGPSRTVAAPAFAAAPAVDPNAAPAVDPSAPAAPQPGATPAAPGGVPEPPLPGVGATPVKTIIVGEERVEVTMRLEIVDFADPQTTAAK